MHVIRAFLPMDKFTLGNDIAAQSGQDIFALSFEQLAKYCAQLEKQKSSLEKSLAKNTEELIEHFEHLESSFELFDATFNAARDAMLVVDYHSKGVRYNDEFATMWHLPKCYGKEMDSRTCFKQLSHSLIDEHRLDDFLSVNSSKIKKESGHISFKDGSTVEFESRIRYCNSKPVGRLYCLNDITQTLHDERILEQSKNDLVLAHRLAKMGSWTYNPNEQILTLSSELASLLKVAENDRVWPVQRYIDAIHENDRYRVEKAILESLNYKSLFQVEHRLIVEETEYYVINRGGYEENSHHIHPRLLGLIQDITKDKDYVERMKLSSQFFQSSLQGNILMDRKLNILEYNKVAAEIFSLKSKAKDLKAFAKGINARLSTAFSDSLTIKAIWHKVFENHSWSGEVNFVDSVLSDKTLWLSLEAYCNEDGRITHFIAIFNDISESKKAQKQLKQLAYFDAQTQLPNRAQFEYYLSSKLALYPHHFEPLVLIYIDLDRFKYVNDSLGHPVGDELLTCVADRLNRCELGNAMIARQGGDEFVIVLEDHLTSEQVEVRANRILSALSAPFHLQGHQVFVGASMGIVNLPEHASDLVTAMKYADIALYKAKNEGKGCFRLWNDDFLIEATPEKMALESSLRQAIIRDELVVFYQSLVKASDGNIHGFEALVRWKHPEKGLIPPDSFIPVAEETNLIVELDCWVIREVARQLLQWLAMGFPTYPVSINISAAHIGSATIVGVFEDIFHEFPQLKSLMQIEITETAMMLDPSNVSCNLNKLFEMGVLSSIDDFGSGYTSLGLLKKLNTDVLKIDRSFIDKITEDDYDRDVAKSIIALANSMSMRVVAEGIETYEQWMMLKEFGCDFLQGFYFNRPVDGEKTTSLLKSLY